MNVDQTRTRQARYGDGIPHAAPLAPRTDASKTVAARMSSAVWRWLKSAALALGVVYAVGWVTLAVGVPRLNRAEWRPSFGRVITGGRADEGMRSFVLAKDPSITPDAAALAWAMVTPATKRASSPGFTPRAVDRRADAPWRNFDLSPLAFRSGMSNRYQGPNPATILAAAAKGLTRDELALLRRYGTAEVWAAFDRVARAPRVDFTAGMLVLPFGRDARADMLQAMSPVATRELAEASVARAAWHLAEGRRDSAEAALRAVVSLGFQVIDNGRGVLDELVGARMVGFGRDALVRLFTATHDPRLAQVAATGEAAKPSSAPATFPGLLGARRWSDDTRHAIISAVSGAGNLTASERMELLYVLPRTACTSTSTMLFGEDPAVKTAFDAARRAYAGLPGQLAVLDLYETQLERPIADLYASFGASSVRMARLISRAYFNPRLANCALIALDGWR